MSSIRNSSSSSVFDEDQTGSKDNRQPVEEGTSDNKPQTKSNKSTFKQAARVISNVLPLYKDSGSKKFVSVSKRIDKNGREKFHSMSSFDYGHHDHDTNLVQTQTQTERVHNAHDDHANFHEVIELLISSLDDITTHFQKDYNEHTFRMSQNVDQKNRAPKEENFMETSETSNVVFWQLSNLAKQIIKQSLNMYVQIELNAPLFDYEGLKSNGYRSFLDIYDTCIRRVFLMFDDLNRKKARVMFVKFLNYSLKDYQSWIKLLQTLEVILAVCVRLLKVSLKDVIALDVSKRPTTSLFVSCQAIQENIDIEETLVKLASGYIEACFGKTCGFQYCESFQLAITTGLVLFASYNDTFEFFSQSASASKKSTGPEAASLSSPPEVNSNSSDNLNNSNNYTRQDSNQNKTKSATSTMNSGFSLTNTISGAVTSFVSTARYALDPDMRAKKFLDIIKNADIEFFKDFYLFLETPVVKFGADLINTKTAINVLKAVSFKEPLLWPKSTLHVNSKEIIQNLVKISPPSNTGPEDSVNIRILSHEYRRGMDELDKFKTVENCSSSRSYSQATLSKYAPTCEASRSLLLHVHGGAFIAFSSQSHEIYLRTWSNELKVPIVSIDYSLAPEHAFPRASEECFFVYVWCLLNKEALGWTGERIICVGDSAGGVLVTNIVQRAIVSGIRVPDALVPIYTPFVLNYSLSPSRIVAFMEPLLNIGLLWRVLGAYYGIDVKANAEYYKKLLNIKSDSNTTLKRSMSGRIVDQFNKILFRQGSTTVSASNDETPDFYLAEDEAQNSSTSKKDQDMKRLLTLYNCIGDSAFLMEKLKTHPLRDDMYMSPLLTDDEVLSKFPPTHLIACNDPFIDDSIEMLKRFKKLNVPSEILVIDNGTAHGFLNFNILGNDTRKSGEEALKFIGKIFADFNVKKQKVSTDLI